MYVKQPPPIIHPHTRCPEREKYKPEKWEQGTKESSPTSYYLATDVGAWKVCSPLVPSSDCSLLPGRSERGPNKTSLISHQPTSHDPSVLSLLLTHRFLIQ
jgi:hypothetical protein